MAQSVTRRRRGSMSNESASHAKRRGLVGIQHSYPTAGIIEAVHGNWDWLWIDTQHGQFYDRELYDALRTAASVSSRRSSRPPVSRPAASRELRRDRGDRRGATRSFWVPTTLSSRSASTSTRRWTTRARASRLGGRLPRHARPASRPAPSHSVRPASRNWSPAATRWTEAPARPRARE